MTLTIEARMQMLGNISEPHAKAVLPTVEAWAVRAENLSRFMQQNSPPTLSPITAFVSSERLWR
ncbi:hypothetical protein [Rhizobium sp. 2MFCol3.1]|uniref:hypothetical protein n=1 Tax=Rhizobium sp. 2MFCol3.1 TaxID=1246459 RepID=UPI000364F28B|nr:hypothetical protein [Rhizobium sp. 2MFCol3.1]